MKVLATIWKELLLLVRDPGGMALIFLMPLVLVVVMAVIQNNTFREFQETRLDVLFVDEDKADLGAAIEHSFQTSPNVRILREWAGEPSLTSELARRLVKRGDCQAAVVIPPGATASLQAKMTRAVEDLYAYYGSDTARGVEAKTPAVQVRIFFDPAIKANFRQALAGAVEKTIAGVQADWLAGVIQDQLDAAAVKPRVRLDLSGMIQVNQADASDAGQPGIVLNAVQHNVPAWSMFAMFFILFPLAGNFIKEREEGSLLRLRLISGSQLPVVSGKFVFYWMVCLMQLILIISAGVYLMPLFGLSRLVLGTNWAGIILAGFAVAMAATGYGLFLAIYFKTSQQALAFGSTSVVILAALGGVWVPVFAMPHVMQAISPYSPLNWGLAAFNDLFLRNASTRAVLPEIVKLVCFSIVMLVASMLIHRSRTSS